MSRIAVFLDRPYIEAHFCYKELAIQLAKNGFNVDLLYINTGTIPVFDAGLNIRLKPFSMTKWGTIRLLLRLFVGNFRYKVVIANPQWPLYWGFKLKLWKSYKLVCLSDEVFAINQNEYSIYQNLYKDSAVKWKKREKLAHQQADATIALGEKRYRLVQEINGLNANHPYFIIPNAPSENIAKPVSEKRNFYREKFNLNKKDVLVLHSGGLQWTYIDALENIHFINPNVKIILQTRRKYEEKHFSNPHIVLSDDFIRYEDIVSVTSGTSIGLLLYDQTNPEELRNGPTAGKLGLYLAAGLPIIACNLSEFNWLEQEGCGIRISKVDELESAILRIMSQYDNYKMNSKRVFMEKFEYSTKFQEFCGWLKLQF